MNIPNENPSIRGRLAMAENRAEARTRYYFREEARRIGWNPAHPRRGGQLLEEQEVVQYWPDLKPLLGAERPDFVMLYEDNPAIVVECRNEYKKIDSALLDGKGYCEKINSAYPVDLVVGLAGTPDTAIQLRVEYRTKRGWVPLVANGHPFTQIPTIYELTTALSNRNGTADVTLPSESVFLETAISISSLLRTAKIEEAERPKILGALIVALHQGTFSFDPALVLSHVNSNVRASIESTKDISAERRIQLIDTLHLAPSSPALPLAIPRIVRQLERLNIRAILQSPVDFLGKFYEAFFRYGSDSAKQGIVFTPRHITKYLAELTDVSLGMTVYDPACGTGGFLVAAFDRMKEMATSRPARLRLKESLYGYETASTVWAMAILNMMFRGDGKSHIFLDSSLDHTEDHAERFDRVLLNPPFSQKDEPERMFIEHALRCAKPGGEVAAVIPAGMLADSQHQYWRRDLQTKHQVLATITMPADLFYPRTVATALLVVRAHTPNPNSQCLFARVRNDGYTISKKKRIEIAGSELPRLAEVVASIRRGSKQVYNDIGRFSTIHLHEIPLGDELCAEKWLPRDPITEDEYRVLLRQLKIGIAIATINHPEIMDSLIIDFGEQLKELPAARLKRESWEPLSRIFKVKGGKSEVVHVRVANGTIKPGTGPAKTPTVVAYMDLETYKAMVLMEASPAELIAMGRIKLEGKLEDALKFYELFTPVLHPQKREKPG